MSKGPEWLSSAVFYEIYPQSFYDSNGDGIGDINGIIEKLDYIESLGCNAMWLNPCFESPFYDAGYDVSNYRKVAPRYGTNADLKRLFKEARKKGIRIILDLVPGHTSVEHPWFKESCKLEKNKYTNRYIWTSKWLEEAGKYNLKMITGFAPREGSYITNFFWAQPALNYGFAKPDPAAPWQLPVDHPDIKALQKELMDIMQFWLDMGAAGFRVDMASSLVKGDTDSKKTMEFWKTVRKMFDSKYPNAALISEWSSPCKAIKAGFHVDFILEFSFPKNTVPFRQEDYANIVPIKGHSFFRKAGKGDIENFMQLFLDHYKCTKSSGYLAMMTGNHDLPRISLNRTKKELELVFAFLLTMPGVPFIYYGDEIGMRYLDLPNKEGGYRRTGARTPMQWNSAKNAGFSTAAKSKLYLPIDPDQKRPNVEAQQSDPDSLLNTMRKLVALRKSSSALSNGAFELLYARKNKYPLIYRRKTGRQQYLIAINPSVSPVSISLPKSATGNWTGHTVELSQGASLKADKTRVKCDMKGVSYGIFKLG